MPESGADQPDLVAAQDAAGKILHDLLVAVFFADSLEIRDQAPRALAFGELQPDLADALAPRRAL